jgi:hypothetical protein
MELLAFIVTRDNRIAKDPGKIAAEAGFDLPEYDVTYQSDNMERCSSAWSSYDWEVKLKEPLSEKKLGELGKLVKKNADWTYDPETNTYIFYHEENERNFGITIYVDDNIVTMGFNWWDALS